jgi:type IV pilus assembly protein PilW
MTRRTRQAGFGLIELMIAMGISLFMLLGFSVVFLNMRQAFGSQNQLAQLQDNERFILMALTTTIENTGFFPDPVNSTAETALPAASAGYTSLSAGQGLAGADGAAGTSDKVTARYVSASGTGLLDCLGAANTSGHDLLITNTFSISASNELLCSTDGGTTTVALVGGVASMSALYSVDISGSGQSFQLLKASEVTAGDYWGSVKTVRITVAMLNPYAGQAGQAATLSWKQTINVMNKS